MFVDELVCMLNLRSFCLASCFWVLGGVGGFFELTNDDSGDCLLVVVVGQGLFLSNERLKLFSAGLAGSLGLVGLVGVVLVFDGEFDPGSGRTLAACLTHASRAERLPSGVLERRTGE